MATKATGRASAKPSPADESAKLMRVNFEVSAAEHMKLKLHATKQGRTISDVLREFVSTLKD
jgi:hypothetical protein